MDVYIIISMRHGHTNIKHATYSTQRAVYLPYIWHAVTPPHNI